MRRSHKTVIWLLLVIFVANCIDAIALKETGVDSITDMLLIFIIASFLNEWCKQHAEENQVSNLGFHAMWCGLLVIAGLPFYAYRFFGFKRGSFLLLKALFCAFITVVITAVTFHIVDISYMVK